MPRIETENMDVKVAIDRCMLGWLAAVTKQSPKVTMCHLYDLTTFCLEGLLKRNGTWSSKKVVFPGTDIKFKVCCSRFHDATTYYKDRGAWFDKRELVGRDDITALKLWIQENPEPHAWNDHRYNYIRCKFTLLNGETEIVMSQHEMETLMTETFLLGDPDEQPQENDNG